MNQADEVGLQTPFGIFLIENNNLLDHGLFHFQVESEPRKIAGHYLRGWFIIDLVAAIPFDLIWSKTGEEDV